MANDETLHRFGGANTLTRTPMRNSLTWRGLSISQEITTITATPPAASFTAKQVEDIGRAHEIFEERMRTMDSSDATLTLRGPMSIEEIKAAVKQMREQLLVAKVSGSSS